MSAKLESDLKKRAARKGLKGEQVNAYVYGTMRKTGWTPEAPNPSTGRKRKSRNLGFSTNS